MDETVLLSHELSNDDIFFPREPRLGWPFYNQESEDDFFSSGLQPEQFFAASKQHKAEMKKNKKKSPKKRKRKKQKKTILNQIDPPPRAEFLIPESYDAEPNCRGGSGVSGFTFVNFALSLTSVAANLVSNANSNNNNNNNNNNDNNDNVNNFNVGNNNNAGNNMNTIAICPFPCLPQPPPVIVGKRKRRSIGELTYLSQQNRASNFRSSMLSDPLTTDISVTSVLLLDLAFKLDKGEGDLGGLSCHLGSELKQLDVGIQGISYAEMVLGQMMKISGQMDEAEFLKINFIQGFTNRTC